MIFEVGSMRGYPSSYISNFARHTFVVDGVTCNSMEGFLQSLKFDNPQAQKRVCLLVGLKAKNRGRNKKWWETQTLYWQGKEIKRDSEEYQLLLDKAFDELAKDDSFQKALLYTGNATLTHMLGTNDITHTILTKEEFLSRLTRIRDRLQKEK